jgi:hypothetical protein
VPEAGGVSGLGTSFTHSEVVSQVHPAPSNPAPRSARLAFAWYRNGGSPGKVGKNLLAPPESP